MMDGDAAELWSFTIRVLPRDTCGAVRIRRLLKYALRGLGSQCVRLAEPDKMQLLRQLVNSLAARCARQAELLAARAENREAS